MHITTMMKHSKKSLRKGWLQYKMLLDSNFFHLGLRKSESISLTEAVQKKNIFNRSTLFSSRWIPGAEGKRNIPAIQKQ